MPARAGWKSYKVGSLGLKERKGTNTSHEILAALDCVKRDLTAHAVKKRRWDLDPVGGEDLGHWTGGCDRFRNPLYVLVPAAEKLFLPASGLSSGRRGREPLGLSVFRLTQY